MYKARLLDLESKGHLSSHGLELVFRSPLAGGLLLLRVRLPHSCLSSVRLRRVRRAIAVDLGGAAEWMSCVPGLKSNLLIYFFLTEL